MTPITASADMTENRIILIGTMFSVGVPPGVQRKMGGEGREGRGGEGKERGGKGKQVGWKEMRKGRKGNGEEQGHGMMRRDREG